MSQQWEYCLLSFTRVGSERLTYYGGSGPISRQQVEWSSAIARLGAAGWELVGVTSSEIGTGLYYKRPIDSGRAIDDAL